MPSCCSLLRSFLTLCLSLTNTSADTNAHLNTYSQWHILASLLMPEEAGKMAKIILTWHIPISSENVGQYKGPVGWSGLYSWETKPGSVAWSGWLGLWIEPAIQQWQTLLTPIPWVTAWLYTTQLERELHKTKKLARMDSRLIAAV